MRDDSDWELLSEPGSRHPSPPPPVWVEPNAFPPTTPGLEHDAVFGAFVDVSAPARRSPSPVDVAGDNDVEESLSTAPTLAEPTPEPEDIDIDWRDSSLAPTLADPSRATSPEPATTTSTTLEAPGTAVAASTGTEAGSHTAAPTAITTAHVENTAQPQHALPPLRPTTPLDADDADSLGPWGGYLASCRAAYADPVRPTGLDDRLPTPRQIPPSAFDSWGPAPDAGTSTSTSTNSGSQPASSSRPWPWHHRQVRREVEQQRRLEIERQHAETQDGGGGGSWNSGKSRSVFADRARAVRDNRVDYDMNLFDGGHLRPSRAVIVTSSLTSHDTSAYVDATAHLHPLNRSTEEEDPFPSAFAVAAGAPVPLPALLRAAIRDPTLIPVMQEAWTDSLRLAIDCTDSEEALASILVPEAELAALAPDLGRGHASELWVAQLRTLRTEASRAEVGGGEHIDGQDAPNADGDVSMAEATDQAGPSASAAPDTTADYSSILGGSDPRSLSLLATLRDIDADSDDEWDGNGVDADAWRAHVERVAKSARYGGIGEGVGGGGETNDLKVGIEDARRVGEERCAGDDLL